MASLFSEHELGQTWEIARTRELQRQQPIISLSKISNKTLWLRTTTNSKQTLRVAQPSRKVDIQLLLGKVTSTRIETGLFQFQCKLDNFFQSHNLNGQIPAYSSWTDYIEADIIQDWNDGSNEVTLSKILISSTMLLVRVRLQCRDLGSSFGWEDPLRQKGHTHSNILPENLRII